MPIKILSMVAILLFASCGKNPTNSNPINSDYEAQEWQLLGLAEENITAIAVDPFDENIIYAGSTINSALNRRGGLFKTTDGGASWNTLISSTIIRDIDIHPTNPQIIYVLGGGALVSKTADGGQTWVAADSGLRVGLYGTPGILAIDPLRPDTLYTGVSAHMAGDLLKSTDGGRNWRAIGEKILGNGVTAIAIDPTASNTIYAGTAAIGAISKSTDGGTSWKRLDFPEVGIVYDLLVHPAHSNIVYAGTWRHGFYFSRNGGANWQDANLGLPDTTTVLKISALSTMKIYIAAKARQKGGVFTSDGDAIHWSLLGDHSFGVGASTITATPEVAILAGAAGIYKLSDRIDH